jgi:hypothetical protein
MNIITKMNIINIIKYNKKSFSIFFLFIWLAIIFYVKPSFIYNENGTFKEFGLGFQHKTVLPIWLVIIFLSILSYLLVLYIT